ncbi:unnamed protein product [Rotaria sp. Silwood2]|nr:unnamed protein product [Rotaria sp. Silwood2]
MLTVDPTERATIDWVLQCSWLIEIAAANHVQRRADVDDEERINILTPDNSRIAKRVASKQRQSANEDAASPLSHIDEIWTKYFFLKI